MCIAILIRHYSERFPLIVFHSREEDMARPTSSLGIHDSILSAIDIKANGVAAVGLNIQTGRFAVLTNCRYKPGINPSGASRGELIKRVLLSQEIPNVKYQGFFHLYYGDMFQPDKPLHYISNAANTLQDTYITPSTRLNVIVRSNEHIDTDDFFRPKISMLQNSLSKALENKPDLSSVDEIIALIQQTLDDVESCLPIPSTLVSLYEWSLLPPKEEQFVLSHVFIPPLSLDTKSVFGTVSQTFIVSDVVSQSVHYWYKTNPEWIWEKQLVKFTL